MVVVCGVVEGLADVLLVAGHKSVPQISASEDFPSQGPPCKQLLLLDLTPPLPEAEHAVHRVQDDQTG